MRACLAASRSGRLVSLGVGRYPPPIGLVPCGELDRSDVRPYLRIEGLRFNIGASPAKK